MQLNEAIEDVGMNNSSRNDDSSRPPSEGPAQARDSEYIEDGAYLVSTGV
jgi:hypothetical protein